MSLTETMKREHIQEAVENDISMQSPKRIEELDFQHVHDFVENAPNYIKLKEGTMPTEVGLYLWKTVVEDFEVVFPSEVFNFKAYNGDVLAPRFKYWNGYTTLLPNIPLAWAKEDELFKDIKGSYDSKRVIKILNTDIACCPFCKKEPVIEFDFKSDIPNSSESFNMKCCTWNNKPRFKSLRKLVSVWNDALK